MRGDLCSRRYCRAQLVISTDGNGHTVATCPPCERNKRGICRDCLLPLPNAKRVGGGHTMRCDRCRRRHRAEKRKRAYHADPERHRLIKRRSAKRPHCKAREKAWRVEWLKKNPRKRDALDKLYDRAYRAQYFSNPENRARRNAWWRNKRKDPAIRAKVNEAQRRRRKARRQAA